MSEEQRVAVRISRRYPATPERVFDAWLDAEQMRHWLFATPTGEMIRAEVDPRVGGRFTLSERRDGVEVEHLGVYLEIDRPRRLVFSFCVPKVSSEATRVTVEITPSGTGCELTLTHEGVIADFAERATGGWIGILDGLAASLD